MTRAVRVVCAMVAMWLALPGAAGAAGAPAARDPSIVIGFIATRSGAGALYGQDAADGFALGLKQLGGRFANQEVRVVAVDEHGSPDQARRAAARLITDQRLDLVITAVSQPSLSAMLPVLESARVFVLNLDHPSDGLAGAQCSPWVFGLAAPANTADELAGARLAADQVRRLVMVVSDSELGRVAVSALKRGFPHEVTVLTPKHGAAVFPDELQKISRLHPDAVYSTLQGGMGVAFIRAFAQSGLKERIALYTTADAVGRPALPAMGSDVEDVLSVSAWSPDLDNPTNRRMVADFEGEYGRPATTRAAQGYDGALLLDVALKQTQGRTGDADGLRAALRRAEFASVRGSFHFNHNQLPLLTYQLRKVARDARGRLNQEVVATLARDWPDREAAACPMHWADEYQPPQPAKTGRRP